MKKNKIILKVIGGVAGLVFLGFLYLSYSAHSEQATLEEELEMVCDSIRSLQSKPVAPIEESVKAIDRNREKISAWMDEALALASRGDEPVRENVTPAAFKQAMVDDAREMSKLSGGVNGSIVAENFGFGFPNIITGGSMPDATKLARLQRQWAEIKLITQTLSNCGAVELVAVNILDDAAPTAAAEVEEKPVRGKRRMMKKEKVEEPTLKTDVQSYEIRFTTRPVALVRVLNAFGTTARFITIDSFSFARENDALGMILGGGKDKAAGASSSPSRRRRRGIGAAQAEASASGDGEKESAQKKGLATDPVTAPPITVTLKLSTFDFGTKLAPKATDAEADEAKEGE